MLLEVGVLGLLLVELLLERVDRIVRVLLDALDLALDLELELLEASMQIVEGALHGAHLLLQVVALLGELRDVVEQLRCPRPRIP